MPDLVRISTDGCVATLTLNRPEQRNALNHDLVQALKEALDQAEADDSVRVVVLTGEGSAFSAGADLKALEAMQQASREENLADSRHLAELFEQIYRLSKPVIGKINGHAIGGGCGLAAVCDMSFVAQDAKVGFPEVRIGFVPAIVMVFVRARVGETVARDLFLSGRLLSGEEAAACGLNSRAVAAGELDAAVDDYAEMIATETSPQGIARTKEMLVRMYGMEFTEALDYAVESNARARETADCAAGVRAFLNKEAPPWKR